MKSIFTEEDYRQLTDGETYLNKFVVIDPNYFIGKHQEAKNQLFLVCSGFGCFSDSAISELFGRYYDIVGNVPRKYILGVAMEDAIQEWERIYKMSRDVFFPVE